MKVRYSDRDFDTILKKEIDARSELTAMARESKLGFMDTAGHHVVHHEIATNEFNGFDSVLNPPINLYSLRGERIA